MHYPRVSRRASCRLLLILAATICVGCLGTVVAESAPVVPLANLRQADARLPRPRTLQTISAIDWSAFPNDLNGRFGRSGRQFVVRPGKPGAVAAAVSSAGKGDTILLQGGTYREGADGDHRALTIFKDGVVLRAFPGQRARIVPRPGTKRALEIKSSDVLVHGLDFVGFKDSGIDIGRDDHTLRNIILSDVTVVFNKDGQWHDGISVYPDNRALKKPAVDGLLMRNVTVENASLGISCNNGPCKSWWMENVKVTNAGGSGSGADAIGVEEGDNIVIVNAETSGATADGIDLKATRVLIINSTVHHVDRNGVKLWHGGDVVNTVIHHTGADSAINFKYGGRYRLLHVVMAFHNYRSGASYNLTAGYDTKEHLDVELANSIFYNTSGGMYFSDNMKLRVSNCIFFGMENRKVLRARAGGREHDLTFSATAGALDRLGLGRGNLFVNPQFVGAERGDFRLRPASPAINRGARAATGYPATDKSGAPRIAGGVPDIGAYEVQ
jgi:hypothetical protein